MQVDRLISRLVRATRSQRQIGRHKRSGSKASFSHCSKYLDQKAAVAAQTISNGFTPMSSKQKDGPSMPRPSSSVILVAPNNHILLLQRVKQSTSFASAHVFPGGNVSAFHDGEVPGLESPDRHTDSDVYRMAAIRETFEESGIILARNNGFGRLIEVPEDQREEGRKLIHSDKIPFVQWLSKKGGRADLSMNRSLHALFMS